MEKYYRRGSGGRGRRTDRRQEKGSEAGERRLLWQLCASVALFLLVYLGRGVLPEQFAAWKSILGADMDLSGAVATLGERVSEGSDLREALTVFLAELTGLEQETPSTSETPQPKLLSPRQRLEDPSFGRLPALRLPDERETGTEAGTSSAEAPAESLSPSPAATEAACVTAVAQAYNDAGEELPENVSLQFYDLGLAETAQPVMGAITSPFGFRDHPVSGAYTFHTAVDIGVPKGTDVLAFADGNVRYIGENDIFGLYVRLDHENNVSTFYAHCSELLVQKGDAVSCGQVIAKSGDTGNATGPHLHFSLDKDGIRLDPAFYLNLA